MTPEWHPAEGAMVPAFGVLVNPLVRERMSALLAGHTGWHVTSGYRSAAHNAEVGGVPRSRHLWGAAIDVVAARPLLAHLAKTAPAHGAVEVIYEGDHLHIGWPRPGGPK